MTKAMPRIGSRKNRRGTPKGIIHVQAPKGIIHVQAPKGIIHVQASFGNTIVTVTDVRGRVVSWASAGTAKFKGPRKGTPYAAQAAAIRAIHAVQGMRRAEVMLKGPGLGRDAALRTIRRSSILLSFVCDVTPIPHNGCRPPKKRRV